MLDCSCEPGPPFICILLIGMIDLLEKGMTLDDGYVVLLLHEFYEKQK